MSLELARAAVLLNPTRFRPEFYDWLKDNYAIFEYFEQAAIKTWNAGHKHFGARTIVEVMRYRTALREIGNGEWKLNDNKTPDMSRLFTILHPEMSGFFEQRRRTANGR